MLAKVLAVEQPRNYTHLLNPFQQGSAVQESRLSVFWREEKKDVGDAQDDKWIAKTFAARTYGVGRCIRQVVGLYVVVMWALRVSPTRPGIADVLRSLRHFPGPSSESHLFVAPVRF